MISQAQRILESSEFVSTASALLDAAPEIHRTRDGSKLVWTVGEGLLLSHLFCQSEVFEVSDTEGGPAETYHLEDATDVIIDLMCNEEDAAQVDALTQRPERHSDTEWRTFTFVSDLGAQSFEGRITHAPCSMGDLFDKDGRLSQRYVIRSVLTRDGELWIDMSLASDACTLCAVRLDVRPFTAAFGASFHELRVEDEALL